MTTDRNPRSGLKQRIWTLAIAIAGVVAIFASTGGGGEPSCAFIIPGVDCGPVTPPINPPPPYTPAPSVSITPAYRVVQVGMPVSFEAAATNLENPTYSWCRAPGSGAACTPLPGTYGSTYTLPSAGMSDDGAHFRVTATGSQGTATSAFGALYVSSMPPVVFEDGEFLVPDWVVTSLPSPAEGVPTFSQSRVATGGNPGAFLSETYDIPATTGQVVIIHSKVSANYHPASQGAIYLIEYSMQCRTASPLTWVTYGPMFEQGGRQFAAEDPRRFGTGVYCSANDWRSTGGLMSTLLVAGPACGAGETCPDLSASAAPLRFGFMVVERSISPGAAQRIVNGYDNWKVSVWRR